MFKWMSKMHNAKGFSLIELVVVMSILAILVVAALPTYRGSRDRAYLAEARGTAQEFKTLAWGYNIENATFDGLDAAKIGLDVPVSRVWDYSVAEGDTTADLLAAGKVGTPVDGITYRFRVMQDGSVTENAGDGEGGGFAGLSDIPAP